MVKPEEFKQTVLKWAERMEVEPKEIHIRKMKRKRGSCSSRGRLTFDFGVLGLPLEERMSIVLHELLHLKYPNHGRMFKTLLDVYLEKAIKEEERNSK